jgi:hypothetical protein
VFLAASMYFEQKIGRVLSPDGRLFLKLRPTKTDAVG